MRVTTEVTRDDQEGNKILILTRRIGEKLVMDNDIEVVILGMKGNQVRLGIKAPKHIVVDRQEIHERKIKELSGNR